MDQRKRNALKRYRERAKIGEMYSTTSLTIGKDTVEFLEKELAKKENRNMSKFVEEIVTEELEKGKKITIENKNRKPGTFPIKKTFTFTSKFYSNIKKAGNSSLFVETILKNKFNL